jgi:uncharacterized membrane protein YbhN (UPF0104 family)
MKRHIRSILGLIIAIVLIALIFQQTDGIQLASAIRSSQPLWLIAGLAVFCLVLLAAQHAGAACCVLPAPPPPPAPAYNLF